VGKHPVTIKQFEAARANTTGSEWEGLIKSGMGNRLAIDAKFSLRAPGWACTDLHPANNVTWREATAYCEWAVKNHKDGCRIRLLNEAEYEYCQRGGTSTIFHCGDSLDSLRGHANIGDQDLQELALQGREDIYFRFRDNEACTSRVGKYWPNGYGLYDMTGNVWCHCLDHFKTDAYESRRFGVTVNPQAFVDPANTDGHHVIRGGSFTAAPVNCRPAARQWESPDTRHCNIGFRVCFDGE
jgi:formylglycine-generating enzyme required for sulfatase activity